MPILKFQTDRTKNIKKPDFYRRLINLNLRVFYDIFNKVAVEYKDGTSFYRTFQKIPHFLIKNAFYTFYVQTHWHIGKYKKSHTNMKKTKNFNLAILTKNRHFWQVKLLKSIFY
jgi:hypothetical protein